MAKRLVMIGIGSQAILAAAGFMLLAGSHEISTLVRIPAMVALFALSAALALLLLLVRRAWERLSQRWRFWITALALPGWSISFPLVMYYQLRPPESAAE